MKKTPLRRGKPVSKKAAKPKRGAKASAKRRRQKKVNEWARAYGSRERVLFVKTLPCRVRVCRERPSENAHSKTGGTGRKADADTILPLCRAHHRELHRCGVKTFSERHLLDLAACAEWTEDAWRRYCVGMFAPQLEY
jgi:hypothetical protein